MSAHIVLVVVGHNDRGGGLINMRLSKLFSIIVSRSFNPHSGSECGHSGCLC